MLPSEPHAEDRNQMLQLTRKKKSGKSVTGLEIEAGSIAATAVSVNGSTQLEATAIAPLPPGAFQDGEVVDPDAVAEALRATFSENDLPKRVRLGIANQRVAVRTMRLPVIDDPEELRWIEHIARLTGRPVTPLVARNTTAGIWRLAERLNAEGLSVRPQVGARPASVLMTLEGTVNPMRQFPAYASIRDLPFV